MARRRWHRRGPWRVQLLFKCNQTLEQYVAQQGWKAATLSSCPMHPEGGCSLQRWGTYFRLIPIECEVARFYCPESHTTFSLLPDFFAARMPGTLEQVEQAAQGVERARIDGSLEKEADELRPPTESTDPIELRSAVAWMVRRHQAVMWGLTVLIALMPEVFGACEPTVASVGGVLGNGGTVLVGVRHLAQHKLGQIPSPIGFLARNCTNTGCESGEIKSVVSSVHATRSGVEKRAETWIKRTRVKDRSPPT